MTAEGFSYHMHDYSGEVPFTDDPSVPGGPITILPCQFDTKDMTMWTDPAYRLRSCNSFDRLLITLGDVRVATRGAIADDRRMVLA